MNIIQMPSPNYWYDPRPIQAIVLHGTAGPLQASIDWLRNPRKDNPNAAVSANFVVSRAGVVYCLVDPALGRKAFANGVVENPDRSIGWLVSAIAQGININRITWSIEHEASEQDMINRRSMTDAQFNSSVELTAMLLRRASLKATHETIIGHNQISGTRKYNCPGVIFPPAYTEVLLTRNPDLKP